MAAYFLRTRIVTLSKADRAPSVAANFRTYVPGVEKEAVVAGAAALPKVTVPGPFTLLHVTVTAPGGFGRPSSVTVPLECGTECGT